MLNVDKFYGFYGVSPRDFEHLEIGAYQIMARDEKIFIMCTDAHVDPFMWLAQEIDGVVFYTRSGFLSVVLLFDSEIDETEEAVSICNRLVGIVQ